MNQTPGTIDLEIDGPVARILLNHPPLNILTTDMRLELLDRIGIIENNRAIHAKTPKAQRYCVTLMRHRVEQHIDAQRVTVR